MSALREPTLKASTQHSSSRGHRRFALTFAHCDHIDCARASCCTLRTMKCLSTSCPRACRLLINSPVSHARTQFAHSLPARSFTRRNYARCHSRHWSTASHARKLTSAHPSKCHITYASAAAEAPTDTQEAEEGKHRQNLLSLLHSRWVHALSWCVHGAETEAVLLEVSGMKCGGCSSAVKRILLGNPEIKSAAVNLLTESAVFKIPAKSDKSALAEEAAALLTKQVTEAVIKLYVCADCVLYVHRRTPLYARLLAACLYSVCRDTLCLAQNAFSLL